MPESCIVENPVTGEPSRVKPPWFESLLVSATALAMP